MQAGVRMLQPSPSSLSPRSANKHPCIHALVTSSPEVATFRSPTTSERSRSHARREDLGRSVRVSAEPKQEALRPTRETEVTLRRPLGIVLAEDAVNNTVFVEEVVPGGNAEASNKVAIGDILVRCSATVLKAGKEGQFEKEGYGQRPYDNWDKVMFDCEGQDFKTVMSAIDSNNPRWGIKTVTLVLKRP